MSIKKYRFWKWVLTIAAIYVILHFVDQHFHILPIAPHIKKVIWTVFLVSGTLLLYIYATTLLTFKSASPKIKALPGAQTEQIKLLEYGFNRIGDMDKILFNDKGQPSWLHFPPHTAKYIKSIAEKNTIVTVSFYLANHKAADNKPMHDLLSIQSSAGLFNIDSIAPPVAASGKQVEIGGKITDYKLDENGIVSGFVIDKFIIEIPKHMEQNIAPMLKAAKDIVVKGYERNANDGFVNNTGFILIKPFAITIDKTYYLL